MPASSHHSVCYSQNFLKDPDLVALLLDRSSLEPEDVVYEIGPGKGLITRQLVLRCRRVVAIEKDPCLAAWLQREFADCPNVTIHQGDFLQYRLPCQPYKVFANIPFNITAAIVGKLTEAHCPPEDIYLCMQREAAEMLLGEPRESLRTLLLKPWFEAAIVHRFERRDFMPAPRVDVVMLRLRKRGPPLVRHTDRQYFRDFIVHCFINWRSTQGSPLSRLFTRHQCKHIHHALGIDLHRRQTSLSFEQWLSLFTYFKAVANERVRRFIDGSEKRLVQQQHGLQKIHRTRRHTTLPLRT